MRGTAAACRVRFQSRSRVGQWHGARWQLRWQVISRTDWYSMWAIPGDSHRAVWQGPGEV